jgi:hypothetical protein
VTSTEDLIGREGLHDLDAILAVTNTDSEALIHSVKDNADAIFTWDYEKGARPALNKLYEKAKKSQWNGETDLDWSIDVDQEALAVAAISADGPGIDLSETVLRNWTEKEWVQFNIESQNWALSQFMHGEQGALLCTAKIVETVPWIDAKYYAATQVMDEARHVEVFARYAEDKLGGTYPISPQLGSLLDDIVNDGRWDITYLGMQIMVEGLALAAFGFMHMLTEEPLLKKLLRYVMSDEARHVAFGVLSLQEYYQELGAAEIKERQEFAFEAALQLRNRFFAQDVWETMGVDPKAIIPHMEDHAEGNEVFQNMLFSKIVPNCRKLGILDAGDGWLRDRFTDIGIIQFEDWTDTTEEYGSLDAVAADAGTAG